jgi:hypothetical protein
MPLNDGVSLLLYALEKEDEDKLFARWVVGPQLQYGFEEFKKLLQPVKVDEKETLEAIDEMMATTAWSKVDIEG